MRFSAEILDHIFSFLVSHRTLIACSKDPVLSPIIERQIYYHTTVHFSGIWLDSDCNFEPNLFSKLVSENPRILNYVRILQIQVELDHLGGQDLDIQKQLDEFAKTLLMFPFLECIMLTTSKNRVWCWPDVFRAALEDRLKLPTVKGVHLVGYQDPSLSLFGNCKNIEDLLLSGSFSDGEEDDDQEDDDEDRSPPFQLNLKSLTLAYASHSLLDSVQPHIKKLQSLKCGESSVDDLPHLLGVCSETLKELDIDLTYSRFPTNYMFGTGKVANNPFPRLSTVPPSLQKLTIRAPVCVENELDEDSVCTPKRCDSYLPAAAEIINAFLSPPQHLILDISLHLFGFSSNLANVDFAPLAVLGAAALSIPLIDLYVHTDTLPSTVTHAHVLSSLADYGGILSSIEEGILVIHPEWTAPGYYAED